MLQVFHRTVVAYIGTRVCVLNERILSVRTSLNCGAAFSPQELANIDQAAAEQTALEAVPGTVHETELEADDDGQVVYDVEVAGEDGKNHDFKVDAGNGEVLYQGLERTPPKPMGLLRPKALTDRGRRRKRNPLPFAPVALLPIYSRDIGHPAPGSPVSSQT
jgi:hypothetical protein